MVTTAGVDTKRIGAMPPGTAAPVGIRTLQVILIKPSTYDDDGYVVRYVRGVLPSNTLAALAGLTRQVDDAGQLGDVKIRIHMMDEHVQRVDPVKVARRFRRPGVRLVVGICGVQTAQFPRAADLAVAFRRLGCPVMVGGFHVSGSIAMSAAGMPGECQRLMDAGVTLVKGEVEDCWADLLRDALHAKLKPFYNILQPPDLSGAELPWIDARLMKRYAYPNMGTIDTGRGCPFNCSFCTIINVQGRKMRTRPTARIKQRIRQNWANKIDYYFFTDDNFSRNPHWEEIFDALIELRRKEGIKIQFMMQIDVPSFRMKNFVAKAAAAGCTQVFIGLETINPDNLPTAGKKQNHVRDYRKMTDTWHANGVACHVGYIIGFPYDTVDSVHQDVIRLRDEVGVDQASFFMLMPLPGSRDQAEAVRRGDPLDPDFTRYDGTHAVSRHPRMTAREWVHAYRRSWRDFYSVEGMKRILSRANNTTYWGLFKNFVWYKYSALAEHAHPMACGFFRLKHPKFRRPGAAHVSFWSHYRKRAAEMVDWARQVGRLYFEMQEVWLATRGRAKIQQNMDQIWRRYEEVRDRLGDSAVWAGQAISQQVDGVRAGAGKIGDYVRPLLRAETRVYLNNYWKQTFAKLRHGRFFHINPVTLGMNLVRDAALCIRFNLEFLTAHGR